MSFAALDQYLRDGIATAKRLRWIGPYVKDGIHWRRATVHERFGRHIGEWQDAVVASALTTSPFFALLRKRPPK